MSEKIETTVNQFVRTVYFSATRWYYDPVKMVDPHSMYHPALFRELLFLERKRAERTNEKFILYRIDVSRLPVSMESDRVIQEICQSLKNVGEIATVGWFTTGKSMGVLIHGVSQDGADELCDKINHVISGILTSCRITTVKYLSYMFPGEKTSGDSRLIVMNKLVYKNWHTTAMRFVSAVLKRSIDVVGSIVGLLLFLPCFIIIPIVIKCTSQGPVFFSQKRVGQYGKVFTCLKFRTMRQSNDDSIHKEFIKKFINDASGAAAGREKTGFKIENDPRVTVIGKFLRKTSLDELPQFINVLFGNMSIVGPRPAIPYEVNEYHTWHCRRVFEMKPGITGFWQVKGRSQTDFTNMVRMDIQYIKQWSPLFDLRLIFSTPAVMVTGRGGY